MSDEVTGETLADLLDLSVRRVQQLAHDGIIPKAARGLYPLDASCRSYIRYLKELADLRVAGASD